MAKQNDIFEYRDVTREDLKLISKLYSDGHQSAVRVGPKGYFLFKKYKELAADIYNMELRQGDVFVASVPRSGTTWTQEMVWLVANDLDYEKAAVVPLTERYPFLECPMFFDEAGVKCCMESATDPEGARIAMDIMAAPVTRILSDMPSPRFMKTHLPMSLIPPNILDTAKVVYVARDPRDVAVSCYYLARLFKVFQINEDTTFKQIWYTFIKDLFLLMPYFEHVKEAWALRHHPNMLFLFYEELSQDMPRTIRRVADFFGKQITPEQMQRLCDHLSFQNFKNNTSVNSDFLKEFGILTPEEKFIRKGKAGGWRDYFDQEMQREAEQWITDNLKDTDLRFPSMNY